MRRRATPRLHLQWLLFCESVRLIKHARRYPQLARENKDGARHLIALIRDAFEV